MTDVDEAVRTILHTALPGRVVGPQDEGWAQATEAWNLAVAQNPIAVVTPLDVDDVREIIRIARDYGVKVTTQAVGHGASWDMAGAILVRPTAFDTVEVDTDRGIARVGAAVRWGDVAAALDGTGFVAGFGSNASVSVVGYLLAGGLSLFARAHGLGVRTLRSVEMVDADGRLRRVDDESDPELMWALRGGGGALGFVTAVEIDLPRVTKIHGGKLVFPLEDGPALFDAILAEGAQASDELSMMVTLTAYPDTPQVATLLRGTRMLVLDAFGFGDDADHMAVIDRIRRMVMPVIDGGFDVLEVGEIHQVLREPSWPVALNDWSRLAHLDRDTIGALVDLFVSEDGEAVTTIQARLLGGALVAGQGYPGIAGAVTYPHFVTATGRAVPGDDRFDRVRERLDAIVDPAGERRTIGTFLTRGQSYAGAYDAAALDRLAEVKAAVDPDGVFVGNRPLR